MNIFSRKAKKGVVSGRTDKEKAKRLARLRVLGVPLAQAVRNNPSHDGVPVPSVVRECLDFISLYGLHVEGVFRVSSPKSRLDELERLTNDGRADEIVFQDAHEAAGLLKRFLRQLPENILTDQLKNLFDSAANACQCVAICQCSAAIRLKELLLQLPSENFYLLAFVFRNVQMVIQKESTNKMNLPAMGILLHAMLDMSRNVVKIFITNASSEPSESEPNSTTITQLFDSVDIGPYLKPKNVAELQRNPPTEKKELEDEIMKQQFMLEYLHGLIQQMREDRLAETTAKEETMWEVQTGITMLKRRLKALDERDQTREQKEEGEGHESVPEGRTAESRRLGTDIPSTEHEQNTNFALLEKQLLAVQTSLRNEIADEKRQIAHLLSVLRELRSKFPEEELNKMSTSQQQMCEETQKNSLVLSENDGTQSAAERLQQKQLQNGGRHSAENAKWEEWCRAEEIRRDRLLGELIRYRRICAQLRARLEHDTVLISLLQQQQKKGEEAVPTAANLLVTRF